MIRLIRVRVVYLTLALLLIFGQAGCTGDDAKQIYTQAIKLWKNQKYDEAVQNLIALTRAYPEHELVDDALFWIGTIYEHYLVQPKQAVRYYRSLNKRFETSPYNLRSMLGIARVFETGDDAEKLKAIFIYRKLQKQKLKNGRSETVQINLARILFDFKQYEQARSELKKLILNKPKSKLVPKAYHLIGYSYYLEGKNDLAEIAFLETDQRYQFDRTSLSSAISLAEMYEETGRLQPAIEVYQTVLSRLDKREVFYQLAIDRITKLRARLRLTNS